MSVLGRQVNRPVLTTSIGGILTIAVVLLTIPLITPLTDLSQNLLTRVTPQSRAVSQPVGVPISLSTTAIINDINNERHSAGLPSLVEDPLLDQTAARKSSELAQAGWKADPEANHLNAAGQQTYTYIFSAEQACRYGSENLSFGNDSSQSVVTAWEHSASHLATMNGDFQRVGVGVSGEYVTAHFCRL